MPAHSPALLQSELSKNSSCIPHPAIMGKVYLVGAGTGDPELLTVKA